MRIKNVAGVAVVLVAILLGSMFMSGVVVASEASGCPSGYTLDAGGTTCSIVVDAELSTAACPMATLGTPGDCYVLVDKQAVALCDLGVLTVHGCLIYGDPPVAGSPQCPDGFNFDQSLGGLCARFEPAGQLPPTCPQGSYGVPDECYILVAPQRDVVSCSEGVLVGVVCVIYGEPPTLSEDTCPVSSEVFEDHAGCYELKTPAEVGPDCVPVGDLCRVPVPLVPGVLVCADGYGFVNGDCVIYGQPVLGPAACPDGSVEDAAGDCRKPVEAQAGAYYCDDTTAALNGTSCVWVVSAVTLFCAEGYELFDESSCAQFEEPSSIEFVCPERSAEDLDGVCRQQVADIPPRLYCENADAVLSGATCTLTVAAIAMCNGLAVTINLNQVASGLGTAGDDVILGTTGDDVIDGRGGDDTICARDGRDRIHGGPGADTIFGGLGIDYIWGDDGDDTLDGQGGSDRMFGGSGNDLMLGDSGADRMFGGAGDDELRGMGGQDSMWGGAGNDLMQGNHQSDNMWGGPGDDAMFGAGGKDILLGEAGDDSLNGGMNTDYLDGGADVDTANGGRGRDKPLTEPKVRAGNGRLYDGSGCVAETIGNCQPTA